jgi:hypothetical protein
MRERTVNEWAGVRSISQFETVLNDGSRLITPEQMKVLFEWSKENRVKMLDPLSDTLKLLGKMFGVEEGRRIIDIALLHADSTIGLEKSIMKRGAASRSSSVTSYLTGVEHGIVLGLKYARDEYRKVSK